MYLSSEDFINIWFYLVLFGVMFSVRIDDGDGDDLLSF